jgi:hypothetical protein
MPGRCTVTVDRLALATRTRKARRTSTCPACRAPILTGMTIARLTSPPAWVHVRCVPAVAAALQAITDVRPDPPGGSTKENRRTT